MGYIMINVYKGPMPPFRSNTKCCAMPIQCECRVKKPWNLTGQGEALLILDHLVPELFPEKVVTLCPALSLDFSVLALSPEQFLAVHPNLILRVQN